MGIAILCMVNHSSVDIQQAIPKVSHESNICYLEQKNSTLPVFY